MPDLFLSYSREDQSTARRFAEGFEREGLSVWWDQALNPGEAFDQVTEEALTAAHAVVVLWSKNSVSSRWVRAEATQANAAGRLLPVMIENCTRPIMFELTHTADLAGWRGNRDDPGWQSFVASVRRFVQRRASGETGLPALLEAPRPTLPQRISGTAAAIGSTAVQTGELLRRHAGQIALALACLAIGGATVWKLRPQAMPEVARFSMELPRVQGTPIATAQALAGVLRPAVSPDGRRIVYSAVENNLTPNGTNTRLWSRQLDQDEATPLPGSENALSPFFSPDGQSVAFFTFGQTFQLKVFDFGGNAVRVLADVKEIVGVPGTWDDQGRIFFSKFSASGIWQIATSGGEPEVFAPPDKEYVALFSPQALPGGDWVLYTGRNADNQFSVLAQNVATGKRKVLVKSGYDAQYLPTGHLVFARGGALYAIAFDARRIATRGREVRVVEGVANNDAGGTGAFSLAANGTLAWLPGPVFAGTATNSSPTMSMVRASRTGEGKALSAELRNYFNPRISPDGSKIAVEVMGADNISHIWIMDARSGVATQLTFEGEDGVPLWTADGREVLFTSRRGEKYAIWRKAADGTGEARHVLDGAGYFLSPTDVRGNTLIYQDLASDANRDLFTFDLAAGGKPKPLLATPADEAYASLSPDGHWMAYMQAPKGGEDAEYQVYVRPFPDAAAGGQRVISEGSNGAWLPHWSPAGDEIHYYVPGGPDVGLWSAQVATTPTTLTPTGRRRLFGFDLPNFVVRVDHNNLGNFYDVARKDGSFVGVGPPRAPPASGSNPNATPAIPPPPRLNVVLHWGEELKKRMPAE